MVNASARVLSRSLAQISFQLEQLVDCAAGAGNADIIQARYDDEDKFSHFAIYETPILFEEIEFVKKEIVSIFPFAKPFIKVSEAVAVPNGGIAGYLANIFGPARFQRIISRADIDVTRKTSRAFSKNDIANFCTHALEVYETDLQELLEEITGPVEKVRFLDQKESMDLRDCFQGVLSLDDCSQEQLEDLFSILIPSAIISRLFTKAIFNFLPPNLLPEEYIIGDRVFYYEKMRQNPPSEEKWFMMVAKKLVNFKMPQGVVFRNSNGGYCKVHETISERGAYKCFLKQIGKQQETVNNVVAYRGTVLSVDTVLEDMRGDFGSQGPQATFEKTKELLTNPEKGFIRAENEKVTVVGMSLGAVHSMLDGQLFEKIVNRVIAIAGPGPDKESMKQYADIVNARQEGENIPVIEHFWELRDVAQFFGGHHLGFNCDPQKAKISINIIESEGDNLTVETAEEAVKSMVEEMKFPEAPMYLVAVARAVNKMQQALLGPHLRNSLWEENYRVHRLTNERHPELVNKLLGHHPDVCDPAWEQMRQIVKIEQIPFAEYVTGVHK